MTYYTAVQPVLLLRAMRVTTKAISRIGGWGRNFSWRICSDLYTPTRTQTSGVSWRRAGILEIQTGVSRSHRFQGESGAPVRFTLHIVLSASDYHINLAQSSSEGYRYIWLRWVGLEPTILLVMSQTRCRFSTPQN